MPSPMATTSHAIAHTSPTENFFGPPVMWRAEAARALGIRDAELPAAISPGAAFPFVLRSMVEAMRSPMRTIVDLGSGAGGASEYLRRATGASIFAVEPAELAREAAQECFPNLHHVAGEPTLTGLPGGCADAVVVCGVLSLLDEPHGVFNEASRLLAPGGHLGIADLYAAGGSDLASEPNLFRTPQNVIDLCIAHGMELVEVGCGDPTPSPAWSRVAVRVDEWIEENCCDRDGYGAWAADRRHLQDHITRGDVIGCCIVAATPGI